MLNDIDRQRITRIYAVLDKVRAIDNFTESLTVERYVTYSTLASQVIRELKHLLLEMRDEAGGYTDPDDALMDLERCVK